MDTWLDTRTQVQDTLAHNRQNPAYHSAYLAGAYRKTDLGGTAARNHLAASLPTEPESQDGKADLQRYQAQQQAAERQKDLCDRISRPHKGAQNGQLTASQRDALMRCAGISVPERSYG